jgi:hypothetical protein
MDVPASFEDRRKELETLISELYHDLWARHVPLPAKAWTAGPDQEVLVRDLTRKLEGRQPVLSPRTSARTLAGIVFQVAAARLRTFAFFAARLSATERKSLAAFLRLSAEERGALATILRLPGEERSELATLLSLSNLECQGLAAFIVDQPAGLPQEADLPEPPQPARRG